MNVKVDHVSTVDPVWMGLTGLTATVRKATLEPYVRPVGNHKRILTVQITFIFIDFRVCDFAFAFKTQNAPCVSRFKRVLFSDRFQFAF